uniref:Uncharacterized protein n=1 Tax=Knipowitschia caucasica TaxID=637954 RepID=A0AAV2MPK5_KNICA
MRETSGRRAGDERETSGRRAGDERETRIFKPKMVPGWGERGEGGVWAGTGGGGGGDRWNPLSAHRGLFRGTVPYKDLVRELGWSEKPNPTVSVPLDSAEARFGTDPNHIFKYFIRFTLNWCNSFQMLDENI